MAFVVQKHDATHLHYDFRLELDGVLKSWAVPQGPCLDPSQKRLAVEVEDHPVEYGSFEGIIPQRQYGGGTVIVWDRGTWRPVGNAADALRAGKLKFHLEGEKLQGGWTLVRMRSKPGEKRNNWLLIKERDEWAAALKDRDIVKDDPASVASGRTIGEMAGDPQGTWSSHGKPSGEATGKPCKATGSRSAQAGPRKRSPSSDFPKTLSPQLATLVETPPEGDQWLHEIKLDGYRLLAFIAEGRAVLQTRNRLDWSHRFPELVETFAQLPVDSAVIDGEVVAVDENGATSFQELQEALSRSGTQSLVFYAFDLLMLNGTDLRNEPLELRKAELLNLVPLKSRGRLLYSDHVDGNGSVLFHKAEELGLEGIVSKRRDRPHVSGRSPDWIKSKTVKREEFVIGGFTDSSASGRALGAILVGYFDDERRLHYAGKVGSGFSEASATDLRERLIARETEKSPFNGRATGAGTTVHWVDPMLVAQIEFSNWTRDKRLRHPVFQGLREDKPARTVSRDVPRRAKSERAKASPSSKRSKGTRSPRVAAMELSPDQQLEMERMRLTHPDKVLYPSEGITKLDLVRFYAGIAEWILPHVENRPLSLVRCPDGQGGASFYQKHSAAGTPDALRQVMIREKTKVEPYLYIDGLAGLLATVQMGVLEIHPWGSRRDDIERPDRLIFDLDPDERVTWTRVIAAAKELRDRLQDLKLTSFVKTTGGKGLHVVVPIQRRTEWPAVKAFTRAFVSRMTDDAPDAYTINMSKAARKGRIFLDYLRNDRGATAVAPYSTRARDGAPVAVPIAWEQLSSKLPSDHFRVDNLPQALERRRTDPWEEMTSVRQSITAAMVRKVEK